ncbi:MAG: hypothetical protein ACREUY_05690 [Burkholderiales bacterium]
MENSRRLAFIVTAIWAGAFLTGCSNNPTLTTSTAAENAEPGKFQPLTDIPIPSGAKLDADKSLILGPADHWMGRAVLKMGLEANEVTVFYQNQMASYGWELVTLAQGKVTNMTFARADRIASIQIESGTFGGSQATIIMSPRQPKQEPAKAR